MVTILKTVGPSDKIEELVKVGYLAQFMKKPDNNSTRARPGDRQDDYHRSQDMDKRRDRTEERGDKGVTGTSTSTKAR